MTTNVHGIRMDRYEVAYRQHDGACGRTLVTASGPAMAVAVCSEPHRPATRGVTVFVIL